jgi:hypothetical protein
MRIVHCLLGAFFLSFSLHANELWLTNDSPFPLQAQVYGAAGFYEQQTVAAGDQWHWSDDQLYSGPATDPNTGASSYTVIWYCAKGGLPYGTNTNIAAGSWVSAQSSEGQKICPLPKKVPPKQTSPTP